VSAGDQEGLPIYPLGSLTHPKGVAQDRAADRLILDHNFGGLQHPDRWRNRLSKRRDQLLRSPQWAIKKLKHALGQKK
jgi:hypothetical protein